MASLAISAEVCAHRTAIRDGVKTPRMQEQCGMPSRIAVSWQAAMILEGRRRVLTSSQAKLDKAQGASTGHVNRGLTLSPSIEARAFIAPHYSACIGATQACVMACVGSSTGQGRLSSSRIARIGRTIAYHVDSDRWWQWYSFEVDTAQRRAALDGYNLALRVNVASDHAWLAAASKARHPTVEHYDYTAVTSSCRRDDGVRRVYSRKDGRDKQALRMLAERRGCAVVFAVSSRRQRNGEYLPLPTTWQGYPVVDGDLDDLWFLRAPGSRPGLGPDVPFVVGLRVKGDRAQVAQCVATGFAVQP